MVSSEMVWENTESFGCEYLRISRGRNSIHAESTVIYLESAYPVQIDYHIELDRTWKTKKVIIEDKRGKSLQINASGTGKWFDPHGAELTELSGAIDVDLSATPFSNSLPINRFDWKLHQQRKIDMVYISIPELELKKVEQTYTYIENRGKTRFFHYQCPNFESFISVDEEGFVVDYPQLFARRF